MINVQTKQREIRALNNAMKELDLTSGFIVIKNEEEIVKIDNRKIKILPIWRFLLV